MRAAELGAALPLCLPFSALALNRCHSAGGAVREMLEAWAAATATAAATAAATATAAAAADPVLATDAAAAAAADPVLATDALLVTGAVEPIPPTVDVGLSLGRLLLLCLCNSVLRQRWLREVSASPHRPRPFGRPPRGRASPPPPPPSPPRRRFHSCRGFAPYSSAGRSCFQRVAPRRGRESKRRGRSPPSSPSPPTRRPPHPPPATSPPATCDSPTPPATCHLFRRRRPYARGSPIPASHPPPTRAPPRPPPRIAPPGCRRGRPCAPSRPD